MNDPDPPNPNPILVPPPKESNDVSRQSRSTRSVSGAGKSSLKQVNVVSKTGLGSMKKSSKKGSKKKRLLKGMDGVEYEVEVTEEMDTRDENLEVNDGNSTVGVNTNEEEGVGSGLDEVSAAVNQSKSVVNEINNTTAYVNENSVENMGSKDISSNVNNTVGEMPVPFENNPILNPGNGKAMNHGSVSASDKMSIGNVVGEVVDVNTNVETVWPSLKETMKKDTVMLDQNNKQPMSFVNAFQGIGEIPGRLNEQAYGRASFARVLIEVDATTYLMEEIEVCYEKMGKSMILKVEYTWRPPLCTHCKVFGHEYKKCSKRVITMEERNEKAKDVTQSGFNNRGRGRNGMMGRGNMSQRNSYGNNGVRFVQVENGANKVDETQVWETKNKSKQDNKGKSVSVSNEGLNNKNKEVVEEGSDEWIQMRKKIDLACDLGMQIVDSEKTKWSEDLKKYYTDKCDAKAKGKMMEGLKWRISKL
ncbi:hypothetical protein CTI12_AA106820 [Artemisia annua]|uniref:Zinc knuckle CX2CX4HX4C n=1 Tax=Artemisia annua TaxID=35608 RepID=A0A2U1PVU4_ARTAN|nr:hypothetical protein CTI12_AA106820 [Artemisia annua]